GEPFFTMELLDGQDFFEYVRPRNGPFDEGRLRRALAQLATGLSALHAADVVHRDVKPPNILVTRAGRVVILDFGLARAKARDVASEDEVVGTVAYMAPEQALDDVVGPAADWYAVGAMLYEALTGRLPHSGASSLQTLLAKNHAPKPPRELVESVPADLDELCVSLLAPEPADRPTGAEVLEVLGVDVDAAPPEVVDDAASFVGRAEELAALHEAFAASRERPTSVLIEGASGLGKTELTHRFAHELHERHADAVVLTGRCYERDSVAFKAFDGLVDELSRYLSQLPRERAAEVLPTEAGLLPRLFPVLGRVDVIADAPREDLPDDPQELRRRGFGALRELLVRLAKRVRLVLVIDDLQWTDRDSLTLLAELLGGATGPRLLLVGTTRPGESALRDQLLGALRGASPRTLSLAPLASAQAEELATQLLPDHSPSAIAAIVNEAGGYPFFVRELARHLERPDGTSAEANVVELDEVLWQRIRSLPDEPRRVLDIVCAASSQVTQALVAHAAEMSDAACFQAVTSLRAAQLVRTSGASRVDTVEPYHDRIRGAVEGHLSPKQRRECHGRLAEALASSGAARTSPHALVGHTLAAGDRAGAARYAEVAARLAIAATAFERAVDFFRMALELGQHDADATRALRLELARALANAGRGAESADAYDAAAEGADPLTLRDCQRLAAEQLLISGHIDRGVERLDEALVSIGEPVLSTPRRALLALLWRRFGLRLRGLGWTERPADAITEAERAQLQIIGASALGLSMVDSIRGTAFNSRFVLLALRVGDPQQVARALGGEATMSAYQGGFARAELMMSAIDAILERHPNDPYIRAWRAAAQGSFAYFNGAFRECDASMRRALELFARVRGTTWERNNSHMFALFALRYLGELTALGAEVDGLRRDAERRGDLYMEVSVQRYGGHYRPLLADRADEAVEGLESTVWPAPVNVFHLQDWQRLEARCDIALYRGTAAELRATSDAAFEALGRSMLTRIRTIQASALYARGRMLLATSTEPSDMRAVERLARSMPRPVSFFEVFTRLLLAGVREREEDRARAIEELRAALALSERYAMAFHVAVAQRRLALLVEGDEAVELRAASDAWMRS
ncbi:MAG: AAA family ATPase, partial [Sandaracinaceae bacterium]|nr:AAA family ATPase [Sandaracinaceae bacterium]